MSRLKWAGASLLVGIGCAVGMGALAQRQSLAVLVSGVRWIGARTPADDRPTRAPRPSRDPDPGASVRVRLVDAEARDGAVDPELRSVWPLHQHPLTAFPSMRVLESTTLSLVPGRPVERLLAGAMRLVVTLVTQSESAMLVQVEVAGLRRSRFRARLESDLVVVTPSSRGALLIVLSLGARSPARPRDDLHDFGLGPRGAEPP